MVAVYNPMQATTNLSPGVFLGPQVPRPLGLRRSSWRVQAGAMAVLDRHLRPTLALRRITVGLAIASFGLGTAGGLLLLSGDHVAGVLSLCFAVWALVGAPIVHAAWRSSIVEAERAVREESERGIRTFATWLHRSTGPNGSDGPDGSAGPADDPSAE